MTKTLNPMQALILGSLRKGPKSGAQVIEEARKIEGFWTCTRSQVYRDIKTLNEIGAIEVWDGENPIPLSQMYEITHAGRDLFALWSSESFALFGADEHIRNTWVLRLLLAEHDEPLRKKIAGDAAAYHKSRAEGDHPKLIESLSIRHHKLMHEWFAHQANN